MGFLITLFTNGLLINDFHIKLFKKFKIKSIEISLYGISNETYYKVTGDINGFDKINSVIDKLKSNNLPIKLKTILMKQNINEFESMKNYVQKKDIKFKYDYNILKKMNFSSEPLKNSILEKHKNDIFKIEKEKNINSWKEKINHLPNYYLFSCGAGRSSFFISSLGELKLCTFAEFSKQSLLENSFDYIWDNFNEYLQMTYSKNSKCTKCIYRTICDICPVKVYLNTNGKILDNIPIEDSCYKAKKIYMSIKENIIYD